MTAILSWSRISMESIYYVLNYENLCIGCDRRFTDVVGPVLKGLRSELLGNDRTLFAVESASRST